MKLFGKSFGEYIRFERFFLLLLVVVGLGRLILSLAHLPNSVDKFLSLTVLLLLGFLFYSVAVYRSGFGRYAQLWPVLLLQWVTAQSIIILGILISIGTGQENIFSAPEFAGGKDGKNFGHVAGHLIGMVTAPLVLWLVGSVIMFITTKVAPRKQ